MIRSIAAVLALLLCASPAWVTAQPTSDGAGAVQPPPTRLKVGVRTDAKPFVFSDMAGPGYRGASIPDDTDGFLFRLCEQILQKASREAEFWYDFVPVRAGDRLDAMDGMGGELHMLCDPFTMTRKRAGEYHFTPVVFVSGGSFLHWERSASGSDNSARSFRWGRNRLNALLNTSDQPILRWDGTPLSEPLEAPSADGPLQRMRPADQVPNAFQMEVIRCDDPMHQAGQIRSIRVGVIKGSTASEIVDNALGIIDPPEILRSGYETVCYEEFEDHREGIEALCQAERGDAPPLSYYFGDRDIIVSYLEDLQNPQDGAGEPRCTEVTAASRFYSVEPYALPMSPRVPDAWILAIRKAVLDFASETQGQGRNRQTNMFALFEQQFSGKIPSQTLSSVFSLLVVPKE